MIVSLDKKYRYTNSKKARILCVDKPFFSPKVVAMDDSGLITYHWPDGTSNLNANLVEVSQWEHIPIDAPVIVWQNGQNGYSLSKFRGHFAGVNNNGLPTTWRGKATSWTADHKDDKVAWENCELSDD